MDSCFRRNDGILDCAVKKYRAILPNARLFQEEVLKRDIFGKLKQWKDKKSRKPLILKGARQVGKTYILKRFAGELFPNYHYVNFEADETLSKIFDRDLNPKRILQELSFYVNSSINTDHDLMIFDEIQACPKALTSLKYFQEELPNFPICAAGSLLGIHLGQSSFPVGKVEHLDMFPMCFREFLEASGESRYSEFLRALTDKDHIPETVHLHLWDQLKIYFIVGGLPEVVQTYVETKEDLHTSLRIVREKQSDLITDYVSDIAKHSGKQNAMHIERVWKNIPAQLAREQDGSTPKFRFKGVVPGIKAYSRLADAIDWLNTAGLIIKIHIANSAKIPFSAYTMENRFKLFSFDVGILGAMSQLNPKTILDYDYGSYKGYFAENFIAQEFRCAGAGPLYSWKKNTAEIEFIREINGGALPVEVKSGWVTQAKSLKVFAEKYKPWFRTIMSARNMNIDRVNRVHHYPLYLAFYFPLGPGE